ncbi:MAG: phospholipid/cholesterol/gamma-HCH transport system permease protein, partial [Polyangiales bacterium]
MSGATTSDPAEETEGDKEESKGPSPFRADADRLFAWLLAPAVELGVLWNMLMETAFWAVRPPYRWRVLMASMEFIGIGSIFIVSLTGLFMGAVLGLQLADGFSQFNAETQTGAVVGLAMSREIGPV